MDKDILRKRIDVAAGRALADIVIKNGKVVDVYSGNIREADVAIVDGIIAGIGNYQNICIDGCVKVFNDLVDIVDEKPEPQSYDSTKASLIFKQSK